MNLYDIVNKKQKQANPVTESIVGGFQVGDPVIITGDVNYNGKTGEIVQVGREGAFVVVDLYNYGKHSFHSSDVGLNDYAGSDDEEARMYDAGEFGDELDEQGVAEGEEMATFSALKDWRVWDVIVMNNYYRGKYADYGARPYSVVASSPEEAREVVINNPDYVLQDLLSRKLQNGKKVLPRGSALPVEEKRVGDAKPGSITTMGLKKMLTPDGVQSFKFTNGKIVDGAHMQGGEEQGVAEGQTPKQEIDRLKLRQNAEHGGASLKRQAATQARIRELEKQIKDKKGVAEGAGKEAWAAGYKAFHDDVTKCPYAPGSEEASQWNLGWESAQARGWNKQGVAEGSQTIGHEILGMLRQVKRQGHDAMEELYSSCPLLAQFWDQYEGDFRSMVIELSPKTLIRIKAEISAFNQQGVAEGGMDSYEKDVWASQQGFDRPHDHRGLGQELAHERNNLQVAINGKPWKVFPGRGTADSQEEWKYLQSMKAWAAKKSAQTGKKWTVYLTGAEPTLEESDISGLLAAANLNKAFIITAELAEGGTKSFKVKAQSERTAIEKFKQHASMAKIINVKEVPLDEHIGKVKDGYRLYSHTGKNLGTYPTHAGAEKREKQVNYFKHASEDIEEGTGLSAELLANYKKAAGISARELDKAGKYKQADKRFSGIVRATKKEFDNDLKKHPKEDVVAQGADSTSPVGGTNEDITESYLASMKRAGYDL